MNLSKILKVTGLLSYFLSRIGCIALFFMMSLTVVDVAGRYLFNSPILGAFEITEFLVLIIVFSFLGYAQAKKSHVTVDLFYDRLPGKARKVISIFNYAVCVAIFLIIAWMGYGRAIESFHNGEKPLNLSIPNFPFVFFLAFGAVIACIEFVRDIIKELNGAIGKKNGS
ncbi:MAG: TRAP transporter small permease [Desulfosarcinaceae bacterium]